MIEKEVRRILKNIAAMLELKGENPFKSKAYLNAAAIIKEENINLRQAVESGDIANIKGFGKALVEKISEYVNTGRMDYYERLKAEIPEGLLEITQINGIGPKKAIKLFNDLGIDSADGLLKAAEDDELSKIKGFGKASQELIINEIFFRKAIKGKFRQDQLINIASKHLADVASLPDVEKVFIAGDLLLMPEVMSELIFIVVTDSNEIRFDNLPKDASGRNTLDYLIEANIKVKHICSDANNANSNIFLNTGTSEFLLSMIDVIASTQLDLSRCNSDIEIFEKLNLQYIPYELREDKYIIDQARTNSIPDLITPQDLLGMLHNHSTWSDGRNTLREMVLASKEMGFAYFAICDHSRTAIYANGLSIERLLEQHKEIDDLNSQNLGIKILKGIESDILGDGSLDYPDEVLEQLDLVVASVHSSFKMTKSEMTKRITNALRNKYTTILGHPTGRLLLSRQPYELDIDEVLNVAQAENKIIEINASPYRLDLSWDNVRKAKDKGIMISINPDAHTTHGLRDIYYGVTIARKGLLSKSDVVNCMTYDEFSKKVINKAK